MEATAGRTRDRLGPVVASGRIPIIGGFIGATATGVATTLGRGGSDYSAAVVGACLDPSEVQIWTDVDDMLDSSKTA